MNKNLFVDIPYQTKTFIKVSAIIILSSVLSLFVLRSFLTRQLGQDFGRAFFALSHIKSYLMASLAFPVLVFFLTTSVLISIIMIYISHKIAGPLYRVQNYLEVVKTGDLSRKLVFRKDDQIKELAIEINALIEVYREEIKSDEKKLEEISHFMEKLKASYGKEDLDETERILRQLRTII